MTDSASRSRAHPLFLALIALLPLHTVFIRAWVAWKPWMILLVTVAVVDLWETRGFPWSRRVAVGAAVFGVTVLISWPGETATSTFWRLGLALAAGMLLMLVVGLHAKGIDDVLRVVFWSGAVMAVTAFFLTMVTNGVFGSEMSNQINDLPLIERINKPAYLGSGFVALTNWHQDPGYSALWTNVWLTLSIVGWGRGAVRAPVWVGASVTGGLIVASALTLSRTGWGGLAVAIVAAMFSLWRQDRAKLHRGIRIAIWGVASGLVLLSVQLVLDPPDVGGDLDEALDFRVTYLFALGDIDVGEEGLEDPSLVVDDNRLDVWREYLDRYADSPWRGIGLGSGWGEIGLQEPHNLWIQLLAETGVVGLLGFAALLVSLGRGGGSIAGATLAIVFFAGLTQTVLFEPVLWFGLGLWVAGRSNDLGSITAKGGVSLSSK